MPYSPDTWYTPVTIDSTNNGIVFLENSGASTFTVTLAAGDYYLHDDASMHDTNGYRGLLYTLATILNTGAAVNASYGTISGTPANTYTWAVVDPGVSTGLTNNGLQLRADAATHNWGIDWTNVLSTLDAQLFGNPLSSPIADDSSTTDGADQIFSWAQATRHRMVTRDIADGIALDKKRIPYKMQDSSSERPSDRVTVTWDEGYRRRFRYSEVRAPDIHEERANESGWATSAGRAAGDTQAIWYDVWDAFTANRELIVVHNDSNDLQIDGNTYEVVKLWRTLEWEQFADRFQPDGDLHKIEFECWVNQSFANYNH